MPRRPDRSLAPAEPSTPSEAARQAFHEAFDSALARGADRSAALEEGIAAAHRAEGSPAFSFEEYEGWAAGLILSRIPHARGILMAAERATPDVAELEHFRAALLDAVGTVYRAGLCGLRGSSLPVSRYGEPGERNPDSPTAKFFEASEERLQLRSDFANAIDAFILSANKIFNASNRWIEERGHRPRGMRGRPSKDPAEEKAVDALVAIGMRTGKIAELLEDDLAAFRKAKKRFGMRRSADLPKEENLHSAIRRQRRKRGTRTK